MSRARTVLVINSSRCCVPNPMWAIRLTNDYGMVDDSCGMGDCRPSRAPGCRRHHIQGLSPLAIDGRPSRPAAVAPHSTYRDTGMVRSEGTLCVHCGLPSNDRMTNRLGLPLQRYRAVNVGLRRGRKQNQRVGGVHPNERLMPMTH
jgi:hypothetical protein